MRCFLTRPFLTIVFALVAVLVPTSALAAELHQGNSLVVSPGETIDDDLYVFGGTLDVQGTVNGDVIFSGGTSTVSGLITGDLLVFGGTTTLTGDVRGSMRAVGGTVTIGGRVDQDLAIGAGTLDIAPSARIGRDLLAGVGSARIAAPIARNVFIGSGDVTLAGPVGGDVRAEGGTIRLSNGASVAGRFSYASDQQAEIASSVVIGGGIERGESAYGRDLGAALTGVGGLVPDPHLHGGGQHQIRPGGKLAIHADFNRHPKLNLDRRLNLLLYLNRGWRSSTVEGAASSPEYDAVLARAFQDRRPAVPVGADESVC